VNLKPVKFKIKYSFTLFFILFFFVPLKAEYKIKKIFILKNNCILAADESSKNCKKLINGLPVNFTPLRIYAKNKSVYLTTLKSGIFKLKNNKIWIAINSDYFKKRSIYNSRAGYRKISAFSIDENDPDNIVIATKHDIYKSKNGGLYWEKIKMNSIGKRKYITSLAVSGKIIAAGTSFNGIYIYQGKKFKNNSKGLPGQKYSKTLTFREEISVSYTHLRAHET